MPRRHGFSWRGGADDAEVEVQHEQKGEAHVDAQPGHERIERCHAHEAEVDHQRVQMVGHDLHCNGGEHQPAVGGGLGGVEARRTDGELFAIKILEFDDLGAAERQACLREAQLLSRLRHPNVIGFEDAALEGGAAEEEVSSLRAGGCEQNGLRERGDSGDASRDTSTHHASSSSDLPSRLRLRERVDSGMVSPDLDTDEDSEGEAHVGVI